MIGRGRPLRFLVLVMVAWTGMRVALLWPPAGSSPRAIEAIAPPAHASRPVPEAARPARLSPARNLAASRGSAPGAAPASGSPRISDSPWRAPDPARIQMAPPGPPRYGRPEFAAVSFAAPVQPVAMAPLPSRWSASAWLVARPGTGLGAAPGASQLGGSQAGLRVSYLLLPDRRIAAFARVATPLRGRGAEGAIGLEWQPSRAPVRLVAERRFGLDGAPGGTGLGVVAGIDIRVPAGFTLETYGQAGAIRRARIEPYADGAARATRVVARSGDVRLSLGAGVWGASQRDGRRLDLGPSAMLGVPIAGRNLRLALDWRQRVAGKARPGSGPALTIGGDF